jgi:hypothetical protein
MVKFVLILLLFTVTPYSFAQDGATSAEDLLDTLTGSSISPTTLRENELLFSNNGGFQDTTPLGIDDIPSEFDYDKVFTYILGQRTGELEFGSFNMIGGVNKRLITGKFISGHPSEGLKDWHPSTNYFEGMIGLESSHSNGMVPGVGASIKLSSGGTAFEPEFSVNAYSHLQISHDIFTNLIFVESNETEARINAVANISADLIPINNMTLGLNAEGGDVILWESDDGNGSAVFQGITVDSSTGRVGFGLESGTLPQYPADVNGSISLTGDIFGSIGIVDTVAVLETEYDNVSTAYVSKTMYSTTNVTAGVTSTMSALIICTFTVEKDFQNTIYTRLIWASDVDGSGTPSYYNPSDINNEQFVSLPYGFDYQTNWNEEAGYLLALKGIWYSNAAYNVKHELFLQLKTNTGTESDIMVNNFSMIMYALPVSAENLDLTDNDKW